MRRILFVLLLLSVPLAAEPLDALLQQSASLYGQVSADVARLQTAVSARYPEAYYSMSGREVAGVYGPDTVTSSSMDAGTIYSLKGTQTEVYRYPMAGLTSLRLEVGALLDAMVPRMNQILKLPPTGNATPAQVRLDAAVQQLGDHVEKLLKVARVALPDRQGLFDSLGYEERNKIGSWREWYAVRSQIALERVNRALEDFGIRYGSQSDRINPLELWLINTTRPFKGNLNGPSPWEPILRVTPVCLDATGGRLVKAAQAGMSFYFLSDWPGWIRTLHHCGAAVMLADVHSEQLYKLSKPVWGFMAHLGKYQVGAVKDTTGDWKIMSTIDFQLIPTLF